MQIASKARVEPPAGAAGQVIVADRLTKRYGDVTAVRDVSLRVPRARSTGCSG